MKTRFTVTAFMLACFLLSACSTSSDQTVSKSYVQPMSNIEATDIESPKTKSVKRLNFKDDVTTPEEIVVGAVGTVLVIGVCIASYGILCAI